MKTLTPKLSQINDIKIADQSLLFGDCLDRMTQIPDGSVDMVLADLPFGVTRQQWDKTLDFKKLWENYRRVTKPNAAILLFAKPPFDKLLAMSQMKLYRYDWVWEKSRATGHLNANRTPLQAHENVCVFYQKPPTYIPQKTSGHSPVNRFYTRGDGACYGSAERLVAGGGSTERFPRSVVKHAPVPNTQRLHPNQKPVGLLAYLIRTYTTVGQVVLDNTMGAGSTLVACLETGRKGIGIEKDAGFFDVATQRMVNHASAENAEDSL